MPSASTLPLLLPDDVVQIALGLKNRLVGNFRGGVVDLDYRFAMDGDRISELFIV